MSDVLLHLPAGTLLILGGLLLPLLRGRVQAGLLLALPLVSFWHLLQLKGAPVGALPSWTLFTYELTPIRVDGLAFAFATAFHFAAFAAALFSAHLRDTVQQVAGATYAGSAIAAVCAGDLLTLFVFWELTAVTSVFLVWASRTERAYGAGMRYLILQVASGVLLMSGAIFWIHETGSAAFDQLGLGSTGGLLILLALGVKAAFPLLHSWLQDAYPEATPTGTVWLSAFTTKLAIYALARGYAGEASLLWIGAVMMVFPLLYGVVENDLRRVLAHGLNNQLGFMVVGVGIGGEMAINGVVGLAAAHVVYNSVLFMGLGAVLYRFGTVRASDLGGLARQMPWTTVTYIVAGAAGFPLTMAFLGKSLIVSAAAKHHDLFSWLVLVFASAGIFYVVGVRVAYMAFFGPRRRVLESPGSGEGIPLNMRLAMGLGAAICLLVGFFPAWFYAQLPFAISYDAYTFGHVVTQLQLLLFTGLAFALAHRMGLAVRPEPSRLVDSDVIYRRMLPASIRFLTGAGSAVASSVRNGAMRVLGAGLEWVRRGCGPTGVWSKSWSTSASIMWVAAILGAILLVYYL